MRFFAGATVLLLTACWIVPAQSVAINHVLDVPNTERLTYDIEWRMIHAGTAVIDSQKTSARLKLESAGMVSSLFKVNDAYGVTYDEPFCATASTLDAQEGKKHRETHVVYDRTKNRADYVERDLVKNAVLHSYEIAIPNCVHDTLGALISLRGLSLRPGESVQMPVSDGHHSASVKIEAQERETIKAGAHEYKAIRCETFLMNGIVYTRKGRVFIWLTDDEQRLPVQIQLRMSFPIGTVTLHLAKEEKL
jgi:hypothetical protein